MASFDCGERFASVQESTDQTTNRFKGIIEGAKLLQVVPSCLPSSFRPFKPPNLCPSLARPCRYIGQLGGQQPCQPSEVQHRPSLTGKRHDAIGKCAHWQ